MPVCDSPAIRQFTEELAAAAPAPWLRTLQPALHPPGSGLLRTLEGHAGTVNGVAVTGDGKRAVSASDDKTLKVWDLETGQPATTFRCDGSPFCCAFVGNRRIVAGDIVGLLHFLKLEELP